MKVDALYWDSVRVVCERDPSKSRTLGRCWVEVENGRLRVRNHKKDRWPCGEAVDMLYARAEVTSIGLFEMRVSAQWFSCAVDSDDATFIPVEVICAF